MNKYIPFFISCILALFIFSVIFQSGVAIKIPLFSELENELELHEREEVRIKEHYRYVRPLDMANLPILPCIFYFLSYFVVPSTLDLAIAFLILTHSLFNHSPPLNFSV